jgi:hypothetical protein
MGGQNKDIKPGIFNVKATTASFSTCTTPDNSGQFVSLHSIPVYAWKSMTVHASILQSATNLQCYRRVDTILLEIGR